MGIIKYDRKPINRKSLKRFIRKKIDGYDWRLKWRDHN